MALMTNATKLANLFNPQVVADMIDAKLVDAMRFAPLARVDTTLVGRPGSTVTLPSFAYIGDAVDVAEGADIPIGQLTESTTTATVKKAGKATGTRAARRLHSCVHLLRLRSTTTYLPSLPVSNPI